MILLDAVGHSTARSFVFISLLLSILTHHITIAAPDPTKSVTLSFLDGAGAVIGQPQNIPHAKCTILQVSQFVATGGFASVSTTDLHSALNLYEDPRCQILAGSSVGRWDNVAPVANMVAIRYEGTADASLPTGVVRLEGFPHEMAVQTKIPPMQWVMDPSKGKLLVGVIGSLLGIGVIIGAYQVYQASLYEIPPKKPKKKATGLNIKKIKKKDAYYRKPVRDDQQSFQRLETQELIISPQQSQSQMVERRVAGTGGSRNSQHSESGISLDWNTKTRSNSGNGSDSVLIDMQETKVARIPLREHQSVKSNLNNVMQNDGGIGGDYNNSGNSRARGAGEVVVPMRSFDSNYLQRPQPQMPQQQMAQRQYQWQQPQQQQPQQQQPQQQQPQQQQPQQQQPQQQQQQQQQHRQYRPTASN